MQGRDSRHAGARAPIRSRIAAYALLALVVLPFTRPYPTCSLAMLLATGGSAAATASVSGLPAIAAIRANDGPAVVLGEGEWKEDLTLTPALLVLPVGSELHAALSPVVPEGRARRVVLPLRL